MYGDAPPSGLLFLVIQPDPGSEDPLLHRQVSHLTNLCNHTSPPSGLHFLAIQPDPDSEDLTGLWLLQDRMPPNV